MQPLAALLDLAFDKIDVNERNRVGQSALHLHTYKLDLGCVITLVGYGADLNAQDWNGFAPLHIAVSKGRLIFSLRQRSFVLLRLV